MAPPNPELELGAPREKPMLKIALSIGCLAGVLAIAAEPEFGEMTTIQVDKKPLDMKGGLFAAPLVVDWDNDGKKDLLIGEFCGQPTNGAWKGKIRFYPNTGTDASPEFSTFTYLEADGKQIAVSQH
jgi:hypothetical protein